MAFTVLRSGELLSVLFPSKEARAQKNALILTDDKGGQVLSGAQLARQWAAHLLLAEAAEGLVDAMAWKSKRLLLNAWRCLEVPLDGPRLIDAGLQPRAGASMIT